MLSNSWLSLYATATLIYLRWETSPWFKLSSSSLPDVSQQESRNADSVLLIFFSSKSSFLAVSSVSIQQNLCRLVAFTARSGCFHTPSLLYFQFGLSLSLVCPSVPVPLNLLSSTLTIFWLFIFSASMVYRTTLGNFLPSFLAGHAMPMTTE